jgi:hypothetical protein
MDLAAYRASAEEFTAELSREYYRHFAGLEDELAIEPVYERHAELFAREAVEELRRLAGHSDGDEARARRMLLDFAVEGHLGQETKQLEAERARREAELQLELDGERIGFRESSVVQANEPDAERRAAIEGARLEATVREINPLAREMLERAHALARELGWPSYRAMCEELKSIDLGGLNAQTAAFLDATHDRYPDMLEPELHRTLGFGFAQLRRSDLPWFFRAAHADELFPADRLVASFRETMTGLGIDLDAQPNVILDVERRPKKSPRAFCAPIRVPHEVYLVVPPIGGRDDYVALFHEGGHTEHFAGVDPQLRWEFRQLGDNSITEGFAFLFDHLVEDPEWLRRRLGVSDNGHLGAHARAARFVYLRRYCAKLDYELRLHSDGAVVDELAGTYAELLGGAVGVEWPREMFLTDVDPAFYAANYLRAWALETHLRALLRERFGPAWFDERAAGELLKDLWREGQRRPADELLADVTGARLDFSAMLSDLGLAAAA